MSVSVTLVDRATVRLKALPEKTRQELRPVIVRDAKELASLVRGKLNGGVLQRRSGRLLDSIKSEMRENASTLYGRVFSQGAGPARNERGQFVGGSNAGVPYAAIHEYGGRTKPHDIYPRNARALHFFARSGGEVFASVVHHPGSVIPERSYLRSSLNEMRNKLLSNIKRAGRSAWWA